MNRLLKFVSDSLKTCIDLYDETKDNDLEKVKKNTEDLLQKSNQSLYHDSVMDQFRSVNKTNAYTIEKLLTKVYTYDDREIWFYMLNGSENKPVSNSQIYNMNVNSGYAVTIENTSGKSVCNCFINHDFITQGDPSKFSEKNTGLFLLNLRYMSLNILRFLYPMIREQFLNIYATVFATAVAINIGLSITPAIIAHYFEIRTEMAEAILDKYDSKNYDFAGIPWLL